MRLIATKDGLVSVPAPPSAPTDLVRRNWLKRLGAGLGLGLLAGPTLARASALSPQAVANTNPYIGEIIMFAGNFEIHGWAFCNGQLLSIAQNDTLFALIGTTYGGDGQNTFALPDMRGRLPVHFGQGAGLSQRTVGGQAGQEQTTLTAAQMPAHNHLVNVTNSAATSNVPDGNFPAAANGVDVTDESTVAVNAYASAANAQANPATMGVAGGSQPHSVMNPYLAVNFQISLFGIFPSQA